MFDKNTELVCCVLVDDVSFEAPPAAAAVKSGLLKSRTG
jgi:hypothetical protein